MKLLETYHKGFVEAKIAFTGPRPPKIGGFLPCPMHTEIQNFLERAIGTYDDVSYRNGSDLELEFITGGALGVDTWAASFVLIEGYPLHLYLPFDTMGSNWPMKTDRDILEAHKSYAYEHGVLKDCSQGKGFHKGAYHVRDSQMVADSGLLIAVYDGSGGGTGATFDYAQSKGKLIHRYNPQTKEQTLYVGYEVIEYA